MYKYIHIHLQMNIHVIIQAKKIQEFDVIQFYLNHLQFSNVSYSFIYIYYIYIHYILQFSYMHFI